MVSCFYGSTPPSLPSPVYARSCDFLNISSKQRLIHFSHSFYSSLSQLSSVHNIFEINLKLLEVLAYNRIPLVRHP